MSIQIKNIWKSFSSLQVIADLNMEFVPNKIHCILGPSGCGKTTFLNLLSGLVKPDQGSISGIENHLFSYVFQEDRLLPWATVEENILFVLKRQIPHSELKKTIYKYLKLVGLEDFSHHYPSQLSGGMRQRVAIARAFAYGGDILILDEPFKGLDHERKNQLLNFIRDFWQEQYKYVFFVTHDVDEALVIADIIYMFQGPPLTLERTLNLSIPANKRDINSPIIKRYKSLLI